MQVSTGDPEDHSSNDKDQYEKKNMLKKGFPLYQLWNDKKIQGHERKEQDNVANELWNEMITVIRERNIGLFELRPVGCIIQSASPVKAVGNKKEKYENKQGCKGPEFDPGKV
jgi:hypothetical protein